MPLRCNPKPEKFLSEVEEEIRRRMMAEESVHQPPLPPKPSKLQEMQGKGGITGALAAVLLLLFKLGAPLIAILGKLKFLLFLPKFFLTGGSMFVSMWLQAYVFGWPFAIGIVILIFIHECGHAIAGISRGIPIKGMVFIPFMGAAVSLGRGGKSVTENAFIGIMGPIFGTLGGLVCVAIGVLTNSTFWLVLAHWNLMINLFNLAPTAPLDGGWITPVFSPKLLAVGVLILFILMPGNPMIWILAIMSVPRIVSHWKAKPDDPYFQAKPSDRIAYAAAYLGLAAFLFGTTRLIKNFITDSRRPPIVASVQQRGPNKL